jgi:hypothetical protein
MPVTRTFSIYDESGEKAIVTLSGESIEDIPHESAICVFDDKEELAGTFKCHYSLKVREIK